MIYKVSVNGLDLVYSREYDFIEHVFNLLRAGKSSLRKTIIVHINIRNYYFMKKDKMLYDNIKSFSLPVFEGIGLKACLALKGKNIKYNLNGTDLFPVFMKKLEGEKLKVFLLGAGESSVKLTRNYINRNFPSVNICGYHNGYFDSENEDEIVTDINQSNADILLIGMGFPLQENFVFRNRDKINASLIWNLGGLFDIYSGNKSRAPLFMRKIRLEWLYRFCKEPVRMFHRNTAAAIGTFFYILLNK